MALERIGEIEASGDLTTAANIRMVGTESHEAVVEQIAPVAEAIVTANPTVIAAAASAASAAMGDLGDANFIRQDGPRNWVQNPRFDDPVLDTSGVSYANWYQVSGVKSRVSVTDGPDGTQFVIRFTDNGSPIRQGLNGLTIRGLKGRTARVRITSRALEANGSQVCPIRVLGQKGNPAVTFLDKWWAPIGMAWTVLEHEFTFPDDEDAFTLSVMPHTGGNVGSKNAEVALVEIDLAGAGFAEAVAGEVDTVLAERFDEIQTAARQQILQQTFMTAKGNRIGTRGRVPISIRFDHWLNALKSMVLPLLVDRQLPSGLCVFSRMLNLGDTYFDPDSADVTWAEVEEWCVTKGVEIWSHGQSHGDTPYAGGMQALYDEIVTSKADLEAFMPRVKVQGWMQPGVTPLGGQPYAWLGFRTSDPAALTDHPAGRMIRSTYPVSELYSTGVTRPLPAVPLHGADHVTIDSLLWTQMKSSVDAAVALGFGREFMLHPGLVGQAGRVTLADLTMFLDYLVTLQDQGLIEVVTPSAMYVVDPEATTRLELIQGGDFAAPFVPGTTPGRWSGTTGMTTGVESDRTHLVIPASGGLITQSRTGLHQNGAQGEMYQIVMEARTPTVAVARIVARDTVTPSRLDKTWDIPLTTAWQRIVRYVAIPRDTTNSSWQFGRASGGEVQLKGVHVRKI